jgi:hypothetical protein
VNAAVSTREQTESIRKAREFLAAAGRYIDVSSPTLDQLPTMELEVELESADLPGTGGTWTQIRGQQPATPRQLAARLCDDIATMFLDGEPSEQEAAALREAVTALGGGLSKDTKEGGARGDLSLVERRALCVQAIARWGSEWQQASEEDRPGILNSLRWDLQCFDEAFVWLTKNELERVAVFHPTRRNGKKTAPSILAEIIIEDCDSDGALGIDGVREGKGETEARAIERVRKRLDRDTKDFFGKTKEAEKPR